ncbi:MFS transporter [Rhodococcus sp. NPDC057529]|uniref:MFS transporter n=1 Tax=Rhodococcus sp. NPDC057529 TaxID=3346158 RepID=UPI003670EC6D
MGGTFMLHGFIFATWISRIPTLRGALGLTNGQLGALMLALSAGALIVLPFTGLVVGRFGANKTVVRTSMMFAVGLATVAFSANYSVVPVVVGLFVLGVGHATWDVAMNCQATTLEGQLKRPLIPRLHAGFSIGAVVGAGFGSLMLRFDIPFLVHVLIVAAVLLGLTPLITRNFPTDTAAVASSESSAGGALSAWREPRTLIIGAFIAMFSFCEGTGNDWLAVASIDGHGVSESNGSLMFAAFTAAMTIGRFVGPVAIERLGRQWSAVLCSVSAILGVLSVALTSSTAFVIAGAVFWGIGASLGIPLGISAAGDDPQRAAGRVSAVLTISYVSFLSGPPLIGFLADHTGVLNAIILAAGAAAVGLLLSPILRTTRASEEEPQPTSAK